MYGIEDRNYGYMVEGIHTGIEMRENLKESGRE